MAGAPSVLDLVRLSPEPVFPPGGEGLYRQIALLTELGIEAEHASLIRSLLALLTDDVLDLTAGLLDCLLDLRRLDASILVMTLAL